MGVRNKGAKMVREVYDLFVEVGRICYVGGSAKVVTIVDIIDHKRVLVARPGEKRSPARIADLPLTRQVVNLRRMARSKAVDAAFAEGDVDATFAKSSLGRKLSKRVVRAGMNLRPLQADDCQADKEQGCRC